jgi:hypothetical protein
MYEKEGQQLPGKKGVALGEEAMTRLVACSEEITAEAMRLSGAASTDAKASFGKGADVSAPNTASVAEMSARATGSMVAEYSGAVLPGDQVTKTTATSLPTSTLEGGVDLGGNKRISMTSFKGTTYVDLREFYVVI